MAVLYVLGGHIQAPLRAFICQVSIICVTQKNNYAIKYRLQSIFNHK